MSKSVLINDDINTYNCNICTDKISKNNIIGLKCNFKKHIFCYDCISDWYAEIKNKHSYTKNMCPICRKNGGLLPILNETSFIKNIHYKEDDTDGIRQNCGCILKNKKTICFNMGKKEFNNKCTRHKPELNKTETNTGN